MDEERISDDSTPPVFEQHNAHFELRSATRVHYALHRVNIPLSQDASLREEIAMMRRRLQDCENAAVGLQGVA